jgi:manganese transport protein
MTAVETRMPVVAPTFRQVSARGKVAGAVGVLGPSFVAAIAYVDPGNFSTNLSAGAQFGYRLLWVVILANLMAMPVQYLSAKVGIVTGQSLPEVCRSNFPRPMLWVLWAQAEIIAMATDLAEFVGAAVGLNLLFGVTPLLAGGITAVISMLILGLQARGYRPFERAIAFLLLVVLAGFVFELTHTGVDTHAAAGSLIPGFSSGGQAYLAVGILGATMMPHVIYLHSALTSRRITCADDGERRRLLRLERWDVVVALAAAGFINVTMLLVAAKLFHHGGASSVGTLAEAHARFASMLGGGAALAFAVALLASGISSSGVGTYAGQVVMSGFLNINIPLVLRRVVTMVPALAVLAWHVDPSRILNLSQVLLSFGIPFALVPLIVVARRHRVMGAFTLGGPTLAVMVSIAVVVVVLNGYLVVEQLQHVLPG